MKFYEINNPYYALIRAKNGGDATQVYMDVVCGEQNEFYDINQELAFVDKIEVEKKLNKVINKRVDELMDEDLIQEQLRRWTENEYPEVVLIDSDLI